MFESALYYPTIDIHNERSLKSAALFWDKIETIVPESEERPYRRRSTRILHENNILFAHKVNPFSDDVRGIEENVIQFMETPEGKKSFIKPRNRSVVSIASRRHLAGEFRYDDVGMKREHLEHRLHERYKDFYIHVQKLPMLLRERLGIRDDEDGYVWASQGFMGFYMTLLANRICQNNRLSLLTDRENQNNFSNRILKDGLTPAGQRAREQRMKRGVMYQVIMDDIKIDPSTTMEMIVKYKKDRRHELELFRDKMDKLTAFDVEGKSAKDIEHEIWSIYMGQVKPAMDGVKATLKEAGINWRTGLGTCVFTGLIPAVLGFGSDLKTNIAIGASECIGLAITTIPYVWKRMEVKGSPYSYLMKMDKQLSVSWKSENRVV